MIGLQWPAGVLGPVWRWWRWSIAVPLGAAMTVLSDGSWPGSWADHALVGVLCLVAVVAAGRLPVLRAGYLGMNLVFASLLFLWLAFWSAVVGGPFDAALAGATVYGFLAAADWLSRRGLDRFAYIDPDVLVLVTIHKGVWWGTVDTATPVMLRLVSGATVMLWPGYQYVWWRRDEDLAPADLEATVGGFFDG